MVELEVLGKRMDMMFLRVFSNLNDSMILWENSSLSTKEREANPYEVLKVSATIALLGLGIHRFDEFSKFLQKTEKSKGAAPNLLCKLILMLLISTLLIHIVELLHAEVYHYVTLYIHSKVIMVILNKPLS